MILTIEQIRDLASFAGLKVDPEVDDDERETEIVICGCPPQGIEGENGVVEHYKHVAYLQEYPDEGVFPLGPELKTVQYVATI